MSPFIPSSGWDFDRTGSGTIKSSLKTLATTAATSTALVRVRPTAGRVFDTSSKKSDRDHETYPASKATETVDVPITLQTLPYDVQFAILKHLDPVSSTCVGLTCQGLYKVHRRLHGSVPLDSWIAVYNHKAQRIPELVGLPYLLKVWMHARWKLKYSGPIKKFVELERWYELEDIYWGDGWEST